MTTEGESHEDKDENPITETIETGFTRAFAFAFALAHPSRPPRGRVSADPRDRNKREN